MIAGQDINYEVSEIMIPGYTQEDMTVTKTTDPNNKSDQTITIKFKNKHEKATRDISVTKAWDDKGNQDGIRPDKITVTLKANGETADVENATVELTKDGNWTHTWKDLDTNANGEEIKYTVEEDESGLPDGYSYVKTEGNMTDGFTITNKHTPEVRDVKVKKEWIDDENSQNTRPDPEQVEVTLKANGKTAPIEDATVILNKGNEWSYIWKNVDKKANGEDIEYTVVEKKVPNYDTDIKYTEEGIVVINTVQDLVKKPIPVKKIWIDDDDRDGLRPKNGLEVTITGRVGTTIVPGASQTITLKDTDGEWDGEFTNLPIFYKGDLISYSIEEENVPGYSVVQESTNTENESEGFRITNKHDPVKIKISGTKEWDDDKNRDDARPESITINLLKNGQPFKSVEVKPQNDDWSFSFEDLYKCENGSAITYTLTEETVDGYSSTIGKVTEDTEVMNNYKVNVTNTHTPETITYKITKSWDDLDNNDGIRPGSITVRLKADGVEVDSQVLSEANGWTYTFENLPKYKTGSVGVLIQYTIVEDEVAGYEVDFTDIVSDRSTKKIENTITNKHELIPYDETGKIMVKKIWKDRDNKFNTRPSSITIHLFADGVEIDKAILNASNNWTYTFTGLNKYKEGAVGVEVVYTITEDSVKGYNSSIDGFVVTNTMNPPTEIVPPKTGIESNTNSDNTLFYIVAIILTTLGVTTITFKYER